MTTPAELTSLIERIELRIVARESTTVALVDLADLRALLDALALRGREGEDGRRLGLEEAARILDEMQERRRVIVATEAHCQNYTRAAEAYIAALTLDDGADAIRAAMSTTHPSTPEQP